MAEQLWKGRFSKAVDSRVNDFNSSIRFDQRMIAQDMRGSGVHAAMRAKQGIISEKDCEDILNGLASIADDLAAGRLEIDPNAEDASTDTVITTDSTTPNKRLRFFLSFSFRYCRTLPLKFCKTDHSLRIYTLFMINASPLCLSF